MFITYLHYIPAWVPLVLWKAKCGSMAVVVALGRVIRQEDHEFDTSLGCLERPGFKSAEGMAHL